MRITPETITPDDDRRMHEVACRRCATTVLVHKATLVQTSIQWLSDASSTCPELVEQRRAQPLAGVASGCTSLRTSIDEAVREARLDVARRD